MVQKKEHRRRAVVILLILFIFAANIIRLVRPGTDFLSVIFHAPIPFQTTLFRLDGLMFGCLLRFLEEPIRAGDARTNKIIAWLFLLGSLLIYMYLIREAAPQNIWYTYTLAYLAPAAIFIAALKGLEQKLDNPLFRWIGKSSYGIYAWHYITIFILGRLVRPDFFHSLWGVLIYIGLSIGLGYISTVTLERYFLNLRTRWAP